MSELIQKFNINVTGILHIGAHTCEELSIIFIGLQKYQMNMFQKIVYHLKVDVFGKM